MEQNCHCTSWQCTATVDTKTNLMQGFQTIPAGTVIGFRFQAIVDAFATVDVSQGAIIGFQILDDCSKICPPEIKQCHVERICGNGNTVIVGGILESTLQLFPVLENITEASTGLRLVGTPVIKHFQQPFHCAISVANTKENTCSNSTLCKNDFEVCECTSCPSTNCLDDTSQVIINAFVLPTETSPVPLRFSTCIAQSFRQFNTVTVSVRLKKKQHKKKSKRNSRQQHPILSSISPACVTLPSAATTEVNSGTVPCVTLTGCNLDNAVAVLFNGIVCGDIQSTSPKALLVRVPCAIQLVSFVALDAVPPPAPPTPVTVSVVNVCGQTSNAVQLIINCPPPTAASSV